MDKTDIKITRYEKDGFWIDIVDNGDCWEAWISLKNYGIFTLMFGWPKRQSKSYEEFLEMVEANFNDYAITYRIDYGEE